MLLVSVIMPSYNHERYISESIESILKQTISDLELVVIDDASSDSSRQIIEDYQQRDDRVKAIFHDKNMGIARTVNDGLEIAQGKFIAFTASDDLWVSDKLEKQLKILAQNEDLVVWSEGQIIDATGNPTGELFTQKYFVSKRKKSGHILEELLKGNFICGQSRILKRENLGDIRFCESLRYLNDYLFEIHLASKFEYYFIQEALAKYRIHDRNTITLAREDVSKDIITLRRYFLQQYGNKIASSTKGHIYARMSIAYSRLGQKRAAICFMFKAIKNNPLDRSNLIYLAMVLTKENGFFRNVLMHIYKRWRRIILKMV